jgi:hypothetical protein
LNNELLDLGVPACFVKLKENNNMSQYRLCCKRTAQGPLPATNIDNAILSLANFRPKEVGGNTGV